MTKGDDVPQPQTGGRFSARYSAAASGRAMPRAVGMPVALNVDGLERNRKKWNAVAKAWYRVSEWLATWMPNRIVTDAQAIEDYYREEYGRASTMIPYGAELGRVASREVLGRLGFNPKMLDPALSAPACPCVSSITLA